AENIVGDLLERCCRGSQATGPGRPRALGPWTGTSWAHPGCLPRSGGAPPGCPGAAAPNRRGQQGCCLGTSGGTAGARRGARAPPANILLKNSSLLLKNSS